MAKVLSAERGGLGVKKLLHELLPEVPKTCKKCQAPTDVN